MSTKYSKPVTREFANVSVPTLSDPLDKRPLVVTLSDTNIQLRTKNGKRFLSVDLKELWTHLVTKEEEKNVPAEEPSQSLNSF